MGPLTIFTANAREGDAPMPKQPAPKQAPKSDLPGHPVPDTFGRLRVRDVDTGHERSVSTAQLSHGRYVVLDEPASTVTGDPVPEKLATPKPLSGPTETGQQADSKKENDDA